MVDKSTEKSLLLNEIHHRVKNNFQIIISLIELQIVRNPAEKEVFVDLINRIRSMSLTYEELLLSDDTNHIRFGDYIDAMVTSIKDSYPNEIEFVISKEKDILIPLDIATSAGIAINELIMNSYKHAFNKRKKNKVIEIILLEDSNKVEIHVNDNGSGIDKEYLHEDSKTLGLNLVKMLIKEQLEGTFYIKNDSGTKAFIRFDK